MKGCMNCGNISCGNNKKRESAGCGRWISPEDKIAELEEKVGMAERTRDRLKAMGFPTLASCKEYSAKLETLEKENERLTVDYETLKLHDEEEIGMLKSENAELKEINEGYCRSRDRLISIGFPNFKDCKEYAEHLTKAKELILRLYNAGRDVLMCRAEEKVYDNLSNAINDKSIVQFLEEIKI